MNDTLDNELREIEAQLANLNPSVIPDDMLNRMEQAMIAWEIHLPIKEKIVPFNNIEQIAPTTNTASTPIKSNLHTWGAAAAIALMAGITAVFTTGDSQQSLVAATDKAPAKSSKISMEERIAHSASPGLSRNVTHASNEGITFAGKNEAPFKVLRIEYTEKVTSHDKNGNPIITKKPCVEHILIPVPVH